MLEGQMMSPVPSYVGCIEDRNTFCAPPAQAFLSHFCWRVPPPLFSGVNVLVPGPYWEGYWICVITCAALMLEHARRARMRAYVCMCMCVCPWSVHTCMHVHVQCAHMCACVRAQTAMPICGCLYVCHKAISSQAGPKSEPQLHD